MNSKQGGEYRALITQVFISQIYQRITHAGSAQYRSQAIFAGENGTAITNPAVGDQPVEYRVTQVLVGNPAVTIAMMVAKKIGVQDGIAYMVTQIIGALLASALKNDADWTIGVLHPVYTYELRVEGATRESLLNDLN